jgi:hypothetical protein
MTHAVSTDNPNSQSRDAVPGRVLQAVSESLAGLRFGTIQLTVHEGRVVQLDVTERQRFT